VCIQYDKSDEHSSSTKLLKAGYNCNFQRKALHGPPSLLGGGVHHIYYTTLVAKHAQETMTDAPHNSPMGTSIKKAKLELGMRGRLFDHNFKEVGYLLTDCWIMLV
jgi:hypothetical protein